MTDFGEGKKLVRVTAPGTYTVTNDIDIVEVDTTSGGATNIILQIINIGVPRKTVYISDIGNNCSVGNITVTTLGGNTINNLPALILQDDGIVAEVNIGDRNRYIANLSTDSPSGPVPPPLISKTYAQMASLIGLSALVPGQKYLITDFQTVHVIPNTVVVNVGPIEPLIVLADTPNTLAGGAISQSFPSDEIFYEFVDSTTSGGTKGRIYYRKDTIKNNTTSYDWRAVLFRRWELFPASLKFVVVTDNGLAFADLYTFNNSSSASGCSDNTIGALRTGGGLTDGLNNIVFSGTAVQNTFGAECYNSTFGDSCRENVLGDNCFENIVDVIFQKNTIEGNFANNTTGFAFLSNQIGQGFIGNIIANLFQRNVIGTDFSGNPAIGNSFTDNKIGNSFQTNTIGTTFQSNVIGNDFNSNNLADDFSNNAIGNLFSANTTTGSFSWNTTGYYCVSNSFGNQSLANQIGAYFNNNDFGNTFNYNTIGQQLQFTTAGTGFSNNRIGVGGSGSLIGNNFFANNIFGSFSSNIIGDDFQDNVTNNSSLDTNTIGNNFEKNSIYQTFSSNVITNPFTQNFMSLPVVGCTFPVATITNKILESGNSTFEVSKNNGVSATITLTLAYERICGIINLTHTAAALTITNISLSTGDFPLVIRPIAGKTTTFTSASAPTAVATQIVLPTTNFVATGDNKDYLKVESRSSILFQTEASNYFV